VKQLPVFLAGLLVALGAVDARADEGDVARECAEAANAGQPLRRAGKLRAAREKFAACGRDACPSAIRSRCVPWLSEVDAATPSVVVRARDAAGHDLPAVRVLVDGEPLGGDAGFAVPVDPGKHLFRYESAGGDVFEETVIVAQGEKNRILPVVLGHGAPVTPHDDRSAEHGAPTPPATQTAPEGRLVAPGVAYAIGAGGLAALGIFAYFTARSWSDYFTLKGGCAATNACTKEELDGVRTKRDVAAIGLAVGVTAVAASAFLLLWRTSASDARVTAIPGGGLLEIRGHL
jgi:hypothetical protein